MAESLSTPKTQRSSDPDTLPIVALGASAGGGKALETFFEALPTDTGMAFVVLMHLSPDHESNLTEILGHRTPLPVCRIEDRLRPEPNRVYVLPPKTSLSIEDGRLQLREGPQRREERTEIDTFLHTLAADQGEEGVGIILSGTGADGAQGIKALKEAGGVTMVQEPAEAEYDDMPRSAIETGLIDVVAPVGGLAAQLTQYWTHAVDGPLTGDEELKTKIEELRRTNRDLQNLLEATDIATLLLDRQLQIKRFTPKVSELFNIRATDTGRPLSDFSQQFAYDHLIEDAQTALDSLQPIEKELQTEEDQGFLVRLRPYRTVNDRIDGVVITFVEITDLKQAQPVAERERLYAEDIVETVWEPLLVLDEDLRVQSANDAFYETFQVASEDITGRLVYELGNGQWDIPALHQLLEEVLPSEQFIINYDVEHDFEDLGRRTMRLNARRIDQKQLILLAIEDITDRKQAMEQFRSERIFINRVLETVGALITVVDMDGRIVRFNRESENVSGYAAEEAEGENVFDLLIPPEDHESVRQVMEQHRAGTDQVTQENHWITKGGERRLIRWASTALRDDEGQVQNVIGTGIDIKERRQLEREVVNVSDEERRRIGQDLHDMLASQLAGIAMMARSLAGKVERQEPVTAEDLRRVAELVNESGDQARALSHSLMPLAVQGEALAEGLRHMAARQETMRTDIACSFEAAGFIPPLDGEVASHLYRIASEAVGNAIKHADPDAIAIRLTVEDSRLILTVRDDGVGIPEDTEPTDGLGLHMMRYRSELIGASLDIKPAEEGGTLVRCYLPLQRATQHAEQ